MECETWIYTVVCRVSLNGVVQGGHYGTTSWGVRCGFRRGDLYSRSREAEHIGFL